MAKSKNVNEEEMVQFTVDFPHNNKSNASENAKNQQQQQKRKKQTLRNLYIWSIVLLVLLGATGYILYELLHRHNYSLFGGKGNDEITPDPDFKDELDFKSIFSYPNCGTKLCEESMKGRCKRRARRLVQGVESAPTAWPWMVAITIRGNHVCGGTIVNRRYVLTAAHCLYGRTGPIDAEDVEVVFGAQNHNLSDSSSNEKKHKICTFILHEQFDRDTLENDIALIKLKHLLTFDHHVQPACLSKQLDHEAEGIIIGWGKTVIANEQFSSVLREVKVPLVPHTKCAESNDRIYRTMKVQRSKHLCVGYGSQRNEYACEGDSGGGFFQHRHKQNRWYVQGLVSWIDPSCNSSLNNAYTVLTCVSCFEKWVGQNMDFYIT